MFILKGKRESSKIQIKEKSEIVEQDTNAVYRVGDPKHKERICLFALIRGGTSYLSI